MEQLLAKRMEQMKASEIRELLKLTEQPEMISFAGGLPAAELFPIEAIIKARSAVLETNPYEALQYSVTEGYLPLRQFIAERLNRMQGTQATTKQILITNGSQQGLDLTGKLFLDKGDIVLCESPSYLGAINAFRGYEPQFIEVKTDEEGIDMTHLDELLSKNEVKLIYVIPNFQNPTGRCWSLERRRAFMERMARANVMVIEDDPYGELWYEEAERPSLRSMDKKGNIVYLGSFSKIFCPGYRTGWLVADEKWVNRYVLIKQAVDLHNSTIVQREIATFMEQNSIDEHVENLRSVYKKRRDAMAQSLKQYLPEGASFNVPVGGLFIWVTLPQQLDARVLLERCLEEKVAFVPGGAFFPNGGNQHTMRLNFSTPSEEQIVEGVQRLARALEKYMYEQIGVI